MSNSIFYVREEATVLSLLCADAAPADVKHCCQHPRRLHVKGCLSHQRKQELWGSLGSTSKELANCLVTGNLPVIYTGQSKAVG